MVEEIVRFLFEVGDVERKSCEDDIHELLAIVRKIEKSRGVYLGKKDQTTLDTIEEKYSEVVDWDSLSVAEKQVLSGKVKPLAELLGLDLGVEVSQYQRRINR